MTDYNIDITIKEVTEYYGSQSPSRHTFFIKIDKNGNVDIKRQRIDYLGFCVERGAIYDWLIINDNISIPTFAINMLKTLLGIPNRQNQHLFLNNYLLIIESIKNLKKDIVNCQQQLIEFI